MLGTNSDPHDSWGHSFFNTECCAESINTYTNVKNAFDHGNVSNSVRNVARMQG